jgi:diadenosine tetraphosphatase ApaH/serine/threonine PP2A family protein phosphatase
MIRRTAVRTLMYDLQIHTTNGSCWVVRRSHLCSLLVPAPDGRLSHLRQFRRQTLDTAVSVGLVVVGPFTALPPLLVQDTQGTPMHGHTMGRTIGLAHGLAA